MEVPWKSRWLTFSSYRGDSAEHFLVVLVLNRDKYPIVYRPMPYLPLAAVPLRSSCSYSGGREVDDLISFVNQKLGEFLAQTLNSLLGTDWKGRENHIHAKDGCR